MRLSDISLPDPDFAGAPVSVWLRALGKVVSRQAKAEWRGSPPHLWLLSRPRPEGLGVQPRSFRPVRPDIGRAILQGLWPLAGHALSVGQGGDPWNRPSPGRAFAVELHRFGWLQDLIAAGDAGPREALRLLLEWERVFGRWNPFAWSAEVLEQRVLNLACALKTVAGGASDAERALLSLSLARQARQLSGHWDGLGRAAEQASAVGAAGAALSGAAGKALVDRAIDRLEKVLPRAVLPDGGHASRSPEAALALLFDLMTFDDALLQLGHGPPPEVARAIDRLTGALRFFALADGRLACFQGGEACDPAEVDAARAHDDADAPAPTSLPHTGYEKLTGRALSCVVDAAPPATGPWSEMACAHPLALEVFAGRDRLITNTGWSPRAEGAQPLRLTPSASTAALGDLSVGAPLAGLLARILGARLEGGAEQVKVRRHAAPEGVWVELAHDGWVRRFGLTHERRLYLEVASDELRGEDRFVPLSQGTDRNLPFSIRFHLHPDVRASLARDSKSILLQGPSSGAWWLRNDAREVSIEPSVHMQGGRARRSSQVVLRGQIRGDRGGRVRWKLARVEPGEA